MSIRSKVLASCFLVFALNFVPGSSDGASLICQNIRKLDGVKKWAIVLNYRPETHPIDIDDLRSLDMVVLDPDTHPDFSPFKRKHPVIAYLSVGEAANYRFFWEDIKNKDWVLGENPNWSGAFFVDIRNPEWRKLLIEEVIPKIVEQKFRGLFLDTLDTAQYLESIDPEQYAGSKDAMVSLVADIHEAYPELMLISNNGFSILRKVAPYLSGMIAEGINMMIDFENNGYKPVPPEDRALKINILKEIRRLYGLNVFNIDYVSQTDRKSIRKVKRESQRLGFNSYVAEKNLTEFYNQHDKHEKRKNHKN